MREPSALSKRKSPGNAVASKNESVAVDRSRRMNRSSVSVPFHPRYATNRPSNEMSGCSATALAFDPLASWSTRSTCQLKHDCDAGATKTSGAAFESGTTRSDADDMKATDLPSPLIAGSLLASFGSMTLPVSRTQPLALTICVNTLPVRCRVYTWLVPDVGNWFPARFVAPDENATTLPSALIDGSLLHASAWSPEVVMLTRIVVPPTRSRTKTSCALF